MESNSENFSSRFKSNQISYENLLQILCRTKLFCFYSYSEDKSIITYTPLVKQLRDDNDDDDNDVYYH